MHIVDVGIGEHIDSAAKRLAQAAAEHGRAVMTFNDVSVVANAGDAAADVLRDWNNQSNARHVAWINSPEGKAAAKRREDTIVALQNEHDCLMQELKTLDFADDVAVLDWLCRMQVDGQTNHLHSPNIVEPTHWIPLPQPPAMNK